MDQEAVSIMKEVIKRKDFFSSYIQSFDANLYMKAKTEIKQKNFLLSLVPSDIFLFDPTKKESYLESYSHLKYYAPDQYSQHIIAVNGTSSKLFKSAVPSFMQFFTLNIYDDYTVDDLFELPTSSKALKHYNFNLLETKDTLGIRIYRIAFKPKFTSSSLIEGEMWIADEVFNIYKLEASGYMDFINYKFSIIYGEKFENFLLPQKILVSARFSIAFNVIENQYQAEINYNEVDKNYNYHPFKYEKGYDLSSLFLIQGDSLNIIKDSIYWDKIRKDTISIEERSQLYASYDSISQDTLEKAPFSIKQMTGFLTSSSFYDYKYFQLKYSGLLNPGLIGYSGIDGFTYKQQIRLSKRLTKDRYLLFTPEVGYALKPNQIFYTIPLVWYFWPERVGKIQLKIGNKNRTFSSLVTENVQTTGGVDSIPVYLSKNDYYKDNYGNLTVGFELTNGLLFETGVTYHLRTSLKSYPMQIDSTKYDQKEYRNFSPQIRLTYTPGQYYRTIGYRKIYLESKWPTFSIEYARAIKGVFGSNVDYERIEADIQQSLNFGVMHTLGYRISAGYITNAKTVYFADFNYFTKNYFPQSWNDGIGGNFVILDNYWYNASNAYFQVHAMFETQLFGFYSPKRLSRYVLKERFYAGQLVTPAIYSYTELGYGIGNRIFNAGVFVGLNGLKYNGISFRVAFELFNH